MKYESGSGSTNIAQHERKTMYTYGDISYDKQLEQGSSPIKIGAISADKVPQEFPAKFLEPDGSYGGGRVYSSIADAEQAISDATNQGILPQGEQWGIYELVGDWNTYAYELNPYDYRLNRSTAVLKRVK